MSDLKAAFELAHQRFSPLLQLNTPETEQFYVQRPLRSFKKFVHGIQRAESNTKFLVYGQRGCGKSVELARIGEQLATTHLVCIFEIDQEVEQQDTIHFTEILIAICRQIVVQAEGHGLKIDRSMLQAVQKWFTDVEHEVIGETGGSTTGEVGINWPFKLTVGGSAGTKGRETRRLVAARYLDDLIKLINTLIGHVLDCDQQQMQARLGKQRRRLLVVVDNLDRYPPGAIREVFDNGSAQLLAPQMQVIYTIPLALTRDPDFNQILSNFRNQRMVLPVLPVTNHEGAIADEPRSIARAIIQKRLPHIVRPEIDSAALEEMITKSGGLLSDLLLFMHDACLYAADEPTPRLTLEIARLVISERRKDFSRQLGKHRSAYYTLLQRVQEGEITDDDEYFLELLYQTSILEYENDDEEWTCVHPVVADLLKKV